MECKEEFSGVYIVCINVLIETLWNVKESDFFWEGEWDKVLIETLWNVKDNFDEEINRVFGY